MNGVGFVCRAAGDLDFFGARTVKLQFQIGVGNTGLIDGMFRLCRILFPLFAEEQRYTATGACGSASWSSSRCCGPLTVTACAATASTATTTAASGRSRLLCEESASYAHHEEKTDAREEKF